MTSATFLVLLACEFQLLSTALITALKPLNTGFPLRVFLVKQQQRSLFHVKEAEIFYKALKQAAKVHEFQIKVYMQKQLHFCHFVAQTPANFPVKNN